MLFHGLPGSQLVTYIFSTGHLATLRQTEEASHSPSGANGGFVCVLPSHPHRARALLLSLQLLRNLPDNSLSAVLPPYRPGKSRSRLGYYMRSSFSS